MNDNISALKLTIVVGAIPLLVFVATYVAQEHPVYLWDWGFFFRLYQGYGQQLIDAPKDWLSAFERSIRRDDYNVSTLLPLHVPFVLFGDSRSAYIGSIVALFILPTAYALTKTSIEFSGRSTTQLRVGLIVTAAIVVLLFPPLWQSPLRGMPDVAGILPLTIATLIIVRTDFLLKATIRQAIVVGLLIWAAFLFRRWFAFACFSLLASAGIFALARLLYLKSLSYHTAKHLILRYGIAVITIIIAVSLFQHGLALRILTTSYSDIYSGYQAPFDRQLRTIYRHIGQFYLVLMAFGVVIALVTRNIAVIFTTATAVTTLLLFSRTQAPSVQHILPISAWLLPGAVLTIVTVSNVIGNGFARRLAQILIALISACVFFVSFSYRGEALPKSIKNLAPKHHYRPLFQENFSEYVRLVAKVKQLTENRDRFAVFASSGILSDSLLEAIDHSLNDTLDWASQVDSRDGMRLDPLRARYAIVADPIVLHLDPGAQKTISLPAQEILTQSGIGKAYKLIEGPYQLAHNHRGYIYERIRPLSDDDIRHVETELQKTYPNWTLLDQSFIFSPR